MCYRDFTLRLTRTDRGPVVRVLDSPAGQASRPVPFRPPFTAAELHRLSERLETASREHLAADRPTAAAPDPDLVAIGRRLTRALFPGPVEGLLHQSLAKTEDDPEEGLRIQLRIDPDLDVHDLLQDHPWELLVRPDRDVHLAFDGRSPIVRYLELPRGDRSPSLPERFHILALAPQPDGQPPLDVEGELRDLEGAWISDASTIPPVQVSRLEPPTLEALRAALRAGPVHALHFLGHARQGSPGTGGELLLENDRGGTDAVPADVLARQVADCVPPLRLVVLNACETGRGGGAGRSAGPAVALVEAGVPAVVAMRLPVSDRAALAFSRSLYGDLAIGRPVDAAVAEGRLAIDRALRGSPEWATPSLFLRTRDGRLFTAAEPRSSAGETVGASAGERDGRPGRWSIVGVVLVLVLAGAVAIGLRPGAETEGDGASEVEEPVAATRKAKEENAVGEGGTDGRRRDVRGASESASPTGTADGASTPAGESSPTPSPPPTRTLVDGATVRLPEIGASVRAEFLSLQGEDFVRLTVSPEDGEVTRHPVIGPGTVELGPGETASTLHVLGVDWRARTVELRAVRRGGSGGGP